MAVGTITIFSKNKDDIRFNDILAATVNLALITSGWTPDSTVTGNSIFADASANEIAASGGYSAGGIALSSKAVTSIAGGFKFASADNIWTASGGGIAAWRYGLLYVVGTLWSMTNPLIGYFLGDTTPADTPATTAPNTLTVQVPAAGYFDIT